MSALRWALIVLSFSSSIAFIFALNSPPARLVDGQFSNIEIALLEHTGQADIAFFGTSRTKRAIIASELVTELNTFLGTEPIIYDLSVAGRGYDIGRSLFGILQSRGNLPSVVGIQLSVRGQESAHVLFPIAASWNEILTGPAEGENIFEQLSWRSNQILRKLEFGVLRARLIFRQLLVVREPVAASTHDFSVPIAVSPSALETWTSLIEAHGGLQQWLAVETEENFIDLMPAYGLSVVKQTVEWLHSQGVKVFLYQLPAINEPRLSQTAVGVAERYFAAPIFVPNRALVQAMVPTGMADNSHVTWSGARLYMSSLAEFVVQLGWL